MATVKLKHEQLKKANTTAKIICDEKDELIANLQHRVNILQRQSTTENASSTQIDCAQIEARICHSANLIMNSTKNKWAALGLLEQQNQKTLNSF